MSCTKLQRMAALHRFSRLTSSSLSSSSSSLLPSSSSFLSRSFLPSSSLSSLSISSPSSSFQSSSKRFFSSSSSSSSSSKLSLSRSPLVGSICPSFEADCVFEDGKIGKVALQDFKNKKHLILLFYPLNFTFVCPSEVLAFSNAKQLFDERDAQVLGISVDSVYCHHAWRSALPSEGGIGSITFPLVSDLDKKISDYFGVLTDNKVALRGLFIIDKKDQKILHQIINDLPYGRSVDECVRTLDMINIVEQNEGKEVCPANWKQGNKLMNASLQGVKDYLKETHN